ncbi:Abi-alpha family protein [Nocardia implantans]|uniref:Abi-alpha family protein n=1 Tax=Nocardia implantans TaxID=3108168 RepID=A0ABU6B1B7_9NOCA|nr:MULTISPECIES: Abi-alpha family protein [unclassified Nocardia]MEA3528767.1 Abi-alpha family protein [Nocardia sp. CDC192]MEB3513293.1 Abi-alpha family protein [Nocardia sp. CDC186]
MADDRTGQDVARPGSRAVERSSDVEQRQISNEARLIRGVFRAAGVAAGTVVRGSQWAVGTTYEVTKEITQAALDGESSAEIAERTGNALRSIARSALGVTEGSVREIVSYVPTSNGPTSQQALAVGPYLRSASTEELRRRGDALLARSADVYFTEDVHPAYDRILDELAPDEARILRFMALNGPQPSVDVRTNRPLGIGSELVQGDLTSVPEQAGVRYPDRARSYLINLNRLGLTLTSDDPVVLSRYMVLEVQPVVEAALKKAGRAPKIVRKSLRLTEFGEDFCRTCFTINS